MVEVNSVAGINQDSRNDNDITNIDTDAESNNASNNENTTSATPYEAECFLFYFKCSQLRIHAYFYFY